MSCKANATPSACNFCQSTSENKLLKHHSALYKHLLKHQHKNVGLNIFRCLKIDKNRREYNIFEDELFQLLKIYSNACSLIGHLFPMLSCTINAIPLRSCHLINVCLKCKASTCMSRSS